MLLVASGLFYLGLLLLSRLRFVGNLLTVRSEFLPAGLHRAECSPLAAAGFLLLSCPRACYLVLTDASGLANTGTVSNLLDGSREVHFVILLCGHDFVTFVRIVLISVRGSCTCCNVLVMGVRVAAPFICH